MSPERISAGTRRLVPPMDVYSFGLLSLTASPNFLTRDSILTHVVDVDEDAAVSWLE
jgi:hypothetical protein